MLSDAPKSPISMSLKFKDEIDFVTFDNLMEEDGTIVYELSCLATNITKEVVHVFDFFFSFLKKYLKNNPIICFLLSWTLGFKLFILCFHSLILGKVRQLLNNITKKLFLMFFKCYYHLHPFTEFGRDVVDQRFEEDNSLDMFEMTTNTSEPSMELTNKRFLIFKCYQMDVKNIKCPLQC